MAADPSNQYSPIDDDGRFTLTSRAEVLYLLRSLIERGEMLTVHFNQGRDSALTTLLEANGRHDTLIFDWGGSELMNRRLLEAERHVFVGAPDGIKVQFVTGKVEKTLYGDAPAFVTQLPKDMVRLQRREFYRIETPIIRPLMCVFPMHAKSDTALRVQGVGLGGASLILPDTPHGFEALQEYPDCRIELPEFGTLSAGIEVRYITELQQRALGKVTRMGCRFIGLPHVMQARLQRYMVKCERERVELLR